MPDVALVGVVAPGIENHSLAVLGRALADAGFTHRVVPFLGFAGLDAMLQQSRDARIVGISLQTSEAALAALAFARVLRVQGFRGTIAVGGHFASLAPEAVLACDAVDVVVALAGEQALVGLARGRDPRELPGAITREGRGAPAEPVRPHALRRERLNEHLGVGAADLILSRGCQAHCGYCCVASVSDAAEQLGAERHVRREVESIADEIVESGARAIHFMDDNILPLDPDDALAWAHELQSALARRRAPRIAFSLQLRADVVTPALADALAELGLVRAYVGIDGYSAGQLRAIGRHAPAQAGPRALALLSERGILCVANALLVGPTLGLPTIVREIDGLAQVRHAPVHLLPIEARPGTVYHRRAAQRGLIEGGPLWPAYRFDDERTFLVADLLVRLPTRLALRSVPIALYDLGWALGVARRLAPSADVGDGLATYAAVTAAWNADQIRILRAAVGAASIGKDAIEELLAHELPIVRAHDEALVRACDDALLAVERAVSAIARRPVRAHARGRLLGRVAFAMSIAACGSPSGHPDAAVDGVVDVAIDAPDHCADPSRTATQPPFTLDQDCTCGTNGSEVKVTFDDSGVITSITQADGSPLPQMIEKCLLDLVATYCYPSQAGTKATLNTCHLWIA